MIVETACFINVACLECDLETTAAHAERHRIHVDVIWLSSTIRSLLVVLRPVTVPWDGWVDKGAGCVDIVKDGHIDLHLGAASSPDVGRQSPNLEVREPAALLIVFV